VSSAEGAVLGPVFTAVLVVVVVVVVFAIALAGAGGGGAAAAAAGGAAAVATGLLVGGAEKEMAGADCSAALLCSSSFCHCDRNKFSWSPIGAALKMAPRENKRKELKGLYNNENVEKIF
jgi:hypothetical protein